VHGGVSYLRSLLDRYGDLTRALAAYNAGPEAVDYYGGVPPYRETRAYVDRVLTYYRHYHGDFVR
jgi:soluble lytic murein transglycosylase-like protein